MNSSRFKNFFRGIFGKEDSKKYVDLFDAAVQGDLEGVKYFIEKKGVSVDAVNRKRETAAHIAVKNNHLNVLKYLLEKNPFLIQAEDPEQNKLFHIALKKGFLEIVEFLIHQYGIEDVFKNTTKGETPLQLAAANGHVNIVQYLIDQHKVNILEHSSTISGDTAIHLAAKRGCLNVVGYFLEEKEMDVNIMNLKGQPPVFTATIGNHSNIVRYLVEEFNADVTMIDKDNNTILQYAFENENLPLSRYLLDEKHFNIDINWANNEGETLVFTAIARHNVELLQYLIDEKKAKIDLPDRYGEYPLHRAVKTNYLKIVQYLLARGASPMQKNFYGKTPYEVAKLYNKHVHHGMPNQLLQYLELVTPRRRRSLSSNYDSNQSRNQILSIANDAENYRRDNSTHTMSQLNVACFQNFLWLAIAHFRIPTAPRHLRTMDRNFPLLKESIERKIESLAIEATEIPFHQN